MGLNIPYVWVDADAHMIIANFAESQKKLWALWSRRKGMKRVRGTPCTFFVRKIKNGSLRWRRFLKSEINLHVGTKIICDSLTCDEMFGIYIKNCWTHLQQTKKCKLTSINTKFDVVQITTHVVFKISEYKL